MSNTRSGETSVRTVRVPDALWQDVKELAEQRDETVTDVILRALYKYALDIR